MTYSINFTAFYFIYKNSVFLVYRRKNKRCQLVILFLVEKEFFLLVSYLRIAITDKAPIDIMNSGTEQLWSGLRTTFTTEMSF